MKLGLFADPHYCRAEILCRTRHPSLSLNKVKEAMQTFRAERVDFCICLGDLIDKCDTIEETNQCLEEMMQAIRCYKLPFFAIPGNHDYAVISAEEFFERTGCCIPPYTLEIDTHLLIFLDANYRSDFRRFDIAGVNWKDANLPPEQLEYLRKKLEKATKPCIVLSHENLDHGVQIDHVIKNAADARKIIEDSKKVPIVLQGHYHFGADNVINGIRYLTLPAMCEGTENRYCILDTDRMSMQFYPMQSEISTKAGE